MTAKDGPDAVDNANTYTRYESGMCLKWVRGPCWEIASVYGSAIEAWNGAKYKHYGDRNPPAGAPLFYAGGKYGHVVIAKPGEMRSTDCKSTGAVSDAEITWIENTWGYEYLGWTEDLNGVRLPLATNPAPTPANEEDDEDMFIFRTNADADGADGKGAAYIVFNGHAVQAATGWSYTSGVEVIVSPSEEMDAAFYAAVTRHRL